MKERELPHIAPKDYPLCIEKGNIGSYTYSNVVEHGDWVEHQYDILTALEDYCTRHYTNEVHN